MKEVSGAERGHSKEEKILTQENLLILQQKGKFTGIPAGFVSTLCARKEFNPLVHENCDPQVHIEFL